ncbi:MAG: ATP-binding cassette domain-containing protein [Gammaproteobacteria bacterium]
MNLLALRKFGIAFGDKIILRSVDLDIPDTGCFVLMGPAGTGKSTLLRTLCGINEAVANMRTWGEASYAGAQLGERERPALVAQNVRLMLASILENIMYELPERRSLTIAQQRDLARRLLLLAGLDDLINELDSPVVELPLALQRHLAIMRTAAASPRLLCIDEPTTGLSNAESEALLSYVKYLADRHAVLIVLHNQQEARQLDGNTALLAGGWIQESSASAEFFSQPANQVTREYIRNGICTVPSPNTKPEDLDEFSEYPTPPPMLEEATNYVSDAYGPRGFLWLKKGLLAGTPKPGIVVNEEYDLKALQRVNIRVLISLTEERFDSDLLHRYGIEGWWMPITDMDAPPVDEAIEMCQRVSQQMSEHHAVAYHCKAGLGRTGTMLAAQLIWEGSTALDALEKSRRVEPRWVQSERQLQFLEDFACAVANLHQKIRQNVVN